MSVKSASERLHNLCAALEQDLNESPFTREEWERMDAERLELLAANESLHATILAIRDQRDQYSSELAALKEAAGKVTCKTCGGTKVLNFMTWKDCPDCGPLRAILERKP